MAKSPTSTAAKVAGARARQPKKAYERELVRLQGQLVKAQSWVRAEGQRLVVVFEGVTPRARAERSSG